FNDMIARLERTFNSQRQFIADASHDLRTPLTVVQSDLEFLKSRATNDVDQREAITRSIGEIDRLARLSSDLLLLARADSAQLVVGREEGRLDELIVESVSRLNSLASACGVALRVD